MDQRQALLKAIEQSEGLESYLASNIHQWKQEHIIPMKVADWVGGIETWEQTVDHFLEKHRILVEVQTNLAHARADLRKLDRDEAKL